MAPKRGVYKCTQDYEKIRKQCLAKGELWEDPEFPANDASLFYSQRPPKPFEWKRPSEICDNPQLFVGGASRFDIAQGELGDCWFLAAIASLSMDSKLLYRVIPQDQSFDAGIVRFQFWRYGVWTTVCVDDRLPCYHGRLVFLHSTEKNEFWSALIEKAYAKMHGSYEALKGGTTIEAMEDFTGGVAEVFDLRGKEPKNLFYIMKTAFERSSLMGCSINANPHQLEAKQDNGLIMGHAYSITGVKKVNVSTRNGKADIPLIRIRNPWGQVEWNGAWSDGSDEWKYIPQDERNRLGLTFSDDGEFWMSYFDFVKEYERVEICNLTPDELTEGSAKQWNVSMNDARWQRNATAGGCRNFPETFWINPQIKMALTEEDDDDPDDDDEGCSCIIAVMQKDRRRQRKLGKEMLTIGFAIYKLDDPNVSMLEKDYFLYHASTARSNTFVNSREVSGRFKLPVGHYAIVPSTFDPNEEGDFLVRVFSVKASSAEQCDEETGQIDVKPELPVPSAADSKPDQEDDMFSMPLGGKPDRPMTPAEEAQEKKFKEFFFRLTGDDMEVDAWELQDILNAALKRELKSEGFSIESCKSMVALFDDDMSGKLGFDEFKELWKNIRAWKLIFREFDRDNSGSFNTHELRAALRSVGFRLSHKAFGALVLRYGNKSGLIDFNSFIHCSVKMKGMFRAFNEHESGGQTRMAVDEFMHVTMYS